MVVQRKAQKEYKCPWCKTTIPRGETYININNGKWHYHIKCFDREQAFAKRLVEAGELSFEMDYPARI